MSSNSLESKLENLSIQDTGSDATSTPDPKVASSPVTNPEVASANPKAASTPETKPKAASTPETNPKPASINIKDIEKRLLKRWIEAKLKKLGISDLSVLQKIDKVLKECYVTLRKDRKLDGRNKTAQKERANALASIVGKKKTGNPPDQLNESMGDRSYRRDLVSEYHDKQDELLSIEELGLSCYESDEKTQRWKEKKSEVELTEDDFLSVIDTKITKHCYENNFSKAVAVIDILQKAVILRIESQRLHKTNLASPIEFGNWKGHVKVIVSFMASLAVLFARSHTLTLEAPINPQQEEPDDQEIQMLEVNGIRKIDLKCWMKDKLKTLKISTTDIQKGIEHVLSNYVFRVNDDGSLDQRQRRTALRKREEELKATNPENSPNAADPFTIQKWFEENEDRSYQEVLTEKQKDLLRILGLDEKDNHEDVITTIDGITQCVWDKKDSIDIGRSKLQALESLSILFIEVQWLDTWELTGNDCIAYIHHVSIIVSLMAAVAVVYVSSKVPQPKLED